MKIYANLEDLHVKKLANSHKSEQLLKKATTDLTDTSKRQKPLGNPSQFQPTREATRSTINLFNHKQNSSHLKGQITFFMI